MISLKCGNPLEKSASFTRFVLPFAYSLQTVEQQEEACFTEILEEQLSEKRWRESYLTEETAEVLFKRAKWFELKNGQINFKLGSRNIPISLTPALVLFEFGRPDGNNHSDIFQTGFLSIDAQFDQNNPPSYDELLQFNELFRYWQLPFENHQNKGYKELLKDLQLNWNIGNRLLGEEKDVDAIYFDRWDYLLKYQVNISGKCFGLMPEEWHEQARNRSNGKESKGIKSSPGWIIHSDNRAFVWTCAVIENGINCFKTPVALPKAPASQISMWTRLLNVDRPDFLVAKYHAEWTEPLTYTRWEEYGTVYGFTSHSGAILADICNNNEPPICQHFSLMYFDQILLLLYLRATIFRFSRELHRISATAKARGLQTGPEELRDDFRTLRWQFVLFTNLYQFPQLSNQQQAMELYHYSRKAMEVDDMFAEVEKEIQTTDEYLLSVSEQIQSETGTQLSVVATLGLPIAIVIALFGMDTQYVDIIKSSHLWPLIIIAVFMLFVLFVYRSDHFRKALKELADDGRRNIE
jgi:hypothetical protein